MPSATKHAQCYNWDFLPSGQNSYRGCGWLFAHVPPFSGLPVFSVGWRGSFPLSVQASTNSACWMPNSSPAVLGSLMSASDFSANNSLLCLCSTATASQVLQHLHLSRKSVGALRDADRSAYQKVEFSPGTWEQKKGHMPF